ncbi:unnamed protein product [Onchocerca flexuosa]|uniref:Uncharacterized protein n=1 Tax=Onchocerca flexuosa TaxID=387005 RepID=A0A183HQ16_9BILA|nr:unnamed protein product [Onchocerca flexuosa]
MHSRFPLPPQFISQMFFANITAVPVSSPALPSSSSTTNYPPRLHFDRDLIPYIGSNTTAITTTTAAITPITTKTTTTTATTTTKKSIIIGNEKRLTDDRRTPLIS